MFRTQKSAYVFSCRALTLQDEKRNEFIDFLEDGWRVTQPVVTVDSFYCAKQGRYDSIRVKGERQVEKVKGA